MKKMLFCLLALGAVGCEEEDTLCTTELRPSFAEVHVTPSEGRDVSRVTVEDLDGAEVECKEESASSFECRGLGRTLVLRVYSDDGLVWTREANVKGDECGHPAEVVQWDVTLAEASADEP